MMPITSPAGKVSVSPCKIGSVRPGAVATRFSSRISAAGSPWNRPPARPGCAASSASSRRKEVRAEVNPCQLPIASSTGASARPRSKLPNDESPRGSVRR